MIEAKLSASISMTHLDVSESSTSSTKKPCDTAHVMIDIQNIRKPEWDSVDGGVWSLLELIEILAENYIIIGRAFQYWEGVEYPSEDSLSGEDYSTYEQNLKDLENSCGHVDLVTAKKLVTNSLSDLSPNISYKQACARMAQLRECVHAEIEGKVFLYVPSSRSDYLVFYETDQFGKKRMPAYGQELGHPALLAQLTELDGQPPQSHRGPGPLPRHAGTSAR